MHVVDTLRAIEAHVSGGNKDAGLFENFQDIRLHG
jgi:hypothetical protein